MKRDIFWNLTVPLGFISHGNVQVSVRPRVFGGDKGDPHLHGLDLQRHVAQGEAPAVQVTGKINSKLSQHHIRLKLSKVLTQTLNDVHRKTQKHKCK